MILKLERKISTWGANKKEKINQILKFQNLWKRFAFGMAKTISSFQKSNSPFIKPLGSRVELNSKEKSIQHISSTLTVISEAARANYSIVS